ncbi:MAG: hypothetical protein RMK00_00230 [Bacteroidota bacterium]|nr:hypothetical protein [Candidatus Kapabacteria bacterium]MCS7302548.1 hypothetical protein [Candidatus Kapabacteria bacterium]MCX7936766.1 hypothetical protein [Chlorobiota bacterium]MDW8074190.1 hypothetical protein [Bacteroidota bacterium]
MRISIGTAAFSLLLSLMLWLFIAFQEEYEVTAPIRFEVQLPPDRSLESPLPEHVYVKLRATGWNLLNALYLGGSTRISVGLAGRAAEGIISEAELRSGFRSSVPLRIVSIEPNAISYRLGNIVQKKVPLVPQVAIEPADGYLLVPPLVLVPDSVVVVGSEETVKRIHAWDTQQRTYRNVQTTVVGLVEVVQSPLLRVLPERVLVKGVIQPVAEMTYFDIPVVVESPLQAGETLLPSVVTVTVRGGLGEIERLLDRQEIPVSVRISPQQLRGKGEMVAPIISTPPGVQAVTCEPPYVVLRRIIAVQ